MKELKTYISEGFFNNVGASNRIKLAIDTIKDASINDKINSRERKPEFIDSLTSILKNIEPLIKKVNLYSNIPEMTEHVKMSRLQYHLKNQIGTIV